MSNKPSVLRHVVLFNFKASATPAQVTDIEMAFYALRSKISLIQDFEWGTNNSPEGINQGFTHCFLATFASEADRNAYLPHPAHQEFVALLQNKIEAVLVIDYWAAM